jgi:hypothetical protein
MNFSLRTWFFIGCISIACIPITIHFLPLGIPLISLNITMNRSQALEKARAVAEQNHLAPKDFDQVAIFHLEDDAKTFIELDAGGKDALVDIMKKDLYTPYIWAVRHFKEGDPRQTYIFFKPDGTPYGFQQQLSEDDQGTTLTPDAARAMAETQARDQWHIDSNAYTLIETASETQPSGRIDHTFVYERPDLTIGSAGKYRLRLGVSGDQFSTLSHVLYIPETFTRHYAQMQSTNETIAHAAQLLSQLFYLLGGCILALLWLGRKRWLLIRTPFIWAIGIAFLVALSKLNQLPMIWINYDTALPAQNFLLTYLTKIVSDFAHAVIPLALGFIAAESLSRKAFGNQPQLWSVWNFPNAASIAIAGSTLAAYALVSFDFAYTSIFYAFTTTYYNWWVPSSQFFNPNILATYLPWLEPCIDSLYAGFHEECVYRAIPLAGAALIGDRFGKRRQMIILALIIQAIIFAAGHANYPGQPAYARLVELLLPSCIYGLIYLRYGLLPVIISHALYDITWEAIPLFMSHAPYAWINQLMMIAVALIPAAIVLFSYLRVGSWIPLASSQLNSAWQPPAPAPTLPELAAFKPISHFLTPLVRNGLLLTGIIGLPILFSTINLHNDALPLKTTRQEALACAQEYAKKHGMKDDHWYPIVTVQNTDDYLLPEHRFIWEHADAATYSSLLNTYLLPPRWYVRFVNFDKNLIERAEEFHVAVQDKKRIHGFYHQLPETTPGASLDYAQARERVHACIRKETGFDPNKLLEMEATPLKLPERTDWQFILADPVHYPLLLGQGRLKLRISGDQFSRLSWSVHVPETWERADRNVINKTRIIKTIGSLLLYLLAICATFAIANTRRFRINFAVWRAVFGALLFFKLIDVALSWPDALANISTSEPFYHQIFSIFASQILQALIYTALIGTLLVTLTNMQYRYALPHTPYKNLCAIGFGILSAAILSCVQYLQPSLMPHWAQYTILNSLAPTTSMLITAFTEFLFAGVALGMLYILVDYVTNTGNRNHVSAALITLLFFLAYTSYTPIFSIPFWLFSVTVHSILALAAYYLLLRFHRGLLPLVLLPLIVTNHVQQAAFNAFNDSVSLHLLAAAYCCILAFFWSYAFTMESDRP